MRKIIIIIFLLFLHTSLQAISPLKSEIIKYGKTFLNNLLNKKINDTQKMIYSKIKLKTLDKKKLLQLSDEMMMEKISISEYILYLTGHNLYPFLNKEFQLLSFKMLGKYGAETVINDKIIKELFYYIKFEISYKKNGKIFKDKLIEINIIKENGQYKIFGFIL